MYQNFIMDWHITWNMCNKELSDIWDLTAVYTKITVFWDMVPHTLQDYSKNWGSRFLWNTGTLLPHYTVNNLHIHCHESFKSHFYTTSLREITKAVQNFLLAVAHLPKCYPNTITSVSCKILPVLRSVR